MVTKDMLGKEHLESMVGQVIKWGVIKKHAKEIIL